MSNYFFKRIKNLPTTPTNNRNSNVSPVTPHSKTPVKLGPTITISDDELLESAVKFEQSPQFKQAEEEAKKARGETILSFSNLHSSSFHLTRISNQCGQCPCVLQTDKSFHQSYNAILIHITQK